MSALTASVIFLWRSSARFLAASSCSSSSESQTENLFDSASARGVEANENSQDSSTGVSSSPHGREHGIRTDGGADISRDCGNARRSTAREAIASEPLLLY